MPIYEFYCPDCHMLFNFLSKSVNTRTKPSCPRCKRIHLERQVSMFALTGEAVEGGEMDDLPIDEGKMEKAITALAGEAESFGEDDPRQAAQLMRKFSKMTGMKFGGGMEEALGRLEAGEDPEAIEHDMSDLMDEEEPFVTPEGKGGALRQNSRATLRHDKTLYEM